MRVEIFKDDQKQLVKQDRVQRFLEQGWQLVAEPAPKKTSKPQVKVEAVAEVKKVEEPKSDDLAAPFNFMPTDNQ